MTAECPLINVSDVSQYRQIQSTFEEERFYAYVNEIQQKNLRQLLGGALYLDLFKNIAETKYQELRDGKEYSYSGETIMYYGLKKPLIYWWLALATREGELYHTDYGAVQMVNNEQQSYESARKKEQVAINYGQTATSYANDVIQFLDENSATYTLWEGNKRKNQSNIFSFKL